MQEEQVLLVDEQDKAIGTIGKLEAHQKGLLHRAFSVFIFNSSNQLLLQQRALTKYHSAGLWTNTCCSHPRPEEEITVAAKRRLREEMGMECVLTPAFVFIYKAHFPNGLIEHEYDHVFIGKNDTVPNPNKEEAMDYKYLPFEAIKEEIKQYPENYTEWFKLAYQRVFNIL